MRLHLTSNPTSSHTKKSVVKKMSNINMSLLHIIQPVKLLFVTVGRTGLRCFTITKSRAEKFNHDCSAFATIILLYIPLYAIIIQQELPASIFRSTNAIETLVRMYQSTWSHTPDEPNLHEQYCKIIRCHL